MDATCKPEKKIVCFSGGHSSALAAIETARKYGTEGMILLNHDISPHVEHEDMSAEDFAKALVKNAKTQGATYLAQVKKDAESSGVNGVTSAQPAGMTSGDEFLATIKSVGQKK